MQNSRTLGRSGSLTNMGFHPRAVAPAIAAAIFLCGCGGGSTSSSTPNSPPVTVDSSVSGQYSLLLTSTAGHGTTNIYTNFTQTGKTFAGAGNTLVCPSNDSSHCEGSDPSASPIIPSGTVSGDNVTMTISFPSTAGVDSVTMVGTAAQITNFAGTYTDSLGDAGTWTASLWSSVAGTYSGTFNSASNPLTISPTISITLAQDASFNLTGTATIMSSPCISSLTLSGQAIGGAFSLRGLADKALIIALPESNDVKYDFSYDFDRPRLIAPGTLGAEW